MNPPPITKQLLTSISFLTGIVLIIFTLDWLLPFPFSTIVTITVIFAGILILGKIADNKTIPGDVTKLNHTCMACNKSHDADICPKCGSKAMHVKFTEHKDPFGV